MGPNPSKEVLDQIYHLNCLIQELRLEIKQLKQELDRKNSTIKTLQLFNKDSELFFLGD